MAKTVAPAPDLAKKKKKKKTGANFNVNVRWFTPRLYTGHFVRFIKIERIHRITCVPVHMSLFFVVVFFFAFLQME